MSTELKPCPFCNSPKVTVYLPGEARGAMFGVMCHECAGEGGWCKSQSGAIAAWNRRAATPAQPVEGQSVASGDADQINAMIHARLSAPQAAPTEEAP